MSYDFGACSFDDCIVSLYMIMMRMRIEYARHSQSVDSAKAQKLVNFPSGINDGGGMGALISDYVREILHCADGYLFENHGR
jgi:hypothetical protein